MTTIPKEIRSQHFKTHIKGLDELLRGGLVLPPHDKDDGHINGLVILIKGKPGTGKTTLAQQLIYNLTKEILQKPSGVDFLPSQYFSIEQSQEELENKILNLVINRIFEDMRDFFAGDELMDEKFFKSEKEHIWHCFRVLQELFICVPTIISDAHKEDFYAHLKEHYYDLKFFFNHFIYDSLKNAIIMPLCFKIDDDDFNLIDGLKKATKEFGDKEFLYYGNKIQEKVEILKIFLKEFDVFSSKTEKDQNPSERLNTFRSAYNDIVAELKKDGSGLIDLNILSTFLYANYSKDTFEQNFNRKKEFESLIYANLDPDIKKRFTEILKKYSEPELFYKFNENDLSRLFEDIINVSLQKNKRSPVVNLFRPNFSKINSKEKSKLVESSQKELIKLISEQYQSHLPSEFYVNVKSSDSFHSNADSPYNFMLAQKIHDFINSMEKEEVQAKSNDEGKDKGPVGEKGTNTNKSTDKKFYPCIVLDGLNILSEKEKKLINIGKVIKTLKKKALFSFIIYDGEVDGSIYQDYFADMVIDMKGEVEKESIDYFLHQLQIDKARFQQAALGWHQYKIRDFGILVFQSVHFRIHINNYQADQVLESFKPAVNKIDIEKYIKQKNTLLPASDGLANIEKILLDPEQGSFTAIFGARATFKTTLILKFLYNSNLNEFVKAKGDSLLLSLVDNLGTLKDTCFCPMAHDFDKCKGCHDNFYIFHQRSGCVASHEFFYNLDKRISEHEKKTGNKIARLAFWDLTQLEYRFPLLAADPMFLPGLVEYAKKSGIALIVMGAGNSKLTPAASAIADNVIFCWRAELTDQGKIEWKDKMSENKDESEILCINVDRRQGHIGNEGKELSFIPIINDKIKVDCLRIQSESGKENAYKSLGFTKVPLSKYDLIIDAKQAIDTIIDLQGMGGVNRQSSDRVLKRLADVINANKLMAL